MTEVAAAAAAAIAIVGRSLLYRIVLSCIAVCSACIVFKKSLSANSSGRFF